MLPTSIRSKHYNLKPLENIETIGNNIKGKRKLILTQKKKKNNRRVTNIGEQCLI